jgi:hypothetical protein
MAITATHARGEEPSALFARSAVVAHRQVLVIRSHLLVLQWSLLLDTRHERNLDLLLDGLSCNEIDVGERPDSWFRAIDLTFIIIYTK